MDQALEGKSSMVGLSVRMEIALIYLPSRDVRLWRNMAYSNVCSICCWRHSLINYNIAHGAWDLADKELTEHMISNQIGDVGLW